MALDTRTTPGPHPGTHRPATEGRQHEEETMTLMDLIDRRVATAAADGSIPCHDNDAELWFADTPEGVEFAKALCGTCPAKDECLAGALDRGEPWGVWGGELVLAGVVVPRKRPRGRPRKSEVAA